MEENQFWGLYHIAIILQLFLKIKQNGTRPEIFA